MNDPSLWDWRGVAAVCTFLILVGHAVDWFLRKTARQAILLSLRRLEERLSGVPVRDWQLWIARGAMWSWSTLGDMFERVYETGQTWFENPVDLNQVQARSVARRVIKEQLFLVWSGMRRLLGMIYAGVIPAGVLLGLFMIAYAIGDRDTEEIATILRAGGSVLAIPFATQVAILMGLAYLDEEVIWPSTYKNLRLITAIRTVSKVLVRSVYPLLALSGVATAIAVMYGESITRGTARSAWLSGDGWQAWTLGPINSVSAIAAVTISFAILRLMLRTRRRLALLAVADVVSSAILAVGLHWTLSAVSAGPQQASEARLSNSVVWFVRAISFRMPSADPDRALIPVVLTAFIPVATYSLIVASLGLVVTPGLRIAGYIAGTMGEKDETPFKQLAVFGTLVVALGRVLAEWPYFRSLLRGLFGG